ncbi:MAG: exopolysaccharide biosynthesis polyprenyl glycosylphosphotransferase [Lachnospiraceae bacterium]|nr:exopolysaccharide biosynthesis polyprenyl glycosylphosphotransferase [Lachnospiraceae bacterium]
MNDFWRFLIGLVKLTLFVLVAGTFYAFQAIYNPAIRADIKSAAMTIGIFIVVHIMFMAIYGGYDIGKKSKKNVQNSAIIITWLTDLVAFVWICVSTKVVTDWGMFFSCVGMFLFTLVVQGVLALLLIRLGFEIYYYATRNSHTIYVVNRDTDQPKMLDNIKARAAQIPGDKVVSYTDPSLREQIEKFDNVFLSDIPTEQRRKLIEYCYGRGKNILFTPEISDIVEVTSEYRMFGDALIFASAKTELTIAERFLKRAFDIFGASILLILTLPLFLLSALLIKLDDHGKVFFTQLRATKGGKPFKIYKFRTMIESEATKPMQETDNRVTRAGKILRATRLDELPQFLNILGGSMSLVGPRPEQLVYLHGFEGNYPEYEYRLRVKAGLTGFAQIEGKYNTTNKEKLMLDLMYIQSYSLWLDLKLLLQTVLVMLKEDSTEGF